MITKSKKTTDKEMKKSTEKKAESKKVSKTWLAFQKAIKKPGIEIVDMRAVLK